MDPGNQVVKKKKGQDQPPGHIAEEASVVFAGSDHCGKPLDAAG